MLKDVVEVEAVGDYRLRLRFEDGVEDEADLSTVVPFEGVFAPLRGLSVFAAVRLNPELGAICWPNGADLAPDIPYALSGENRRRTCASGAACPQPKGGACARDQRAAEGASASWSMASGQSRPIPRCGSPDTSEPRPSSGSACR